MSGFVKELTAVYRRVPTADSYAGRALTSPELVAALAGELIGDAAVERFVVLMLDIKNRLHSYATIGVGTVASCPVSPGSVFQAALLANAAGIIVLHVHPSGDTTPSPEDTALTHRLVELGRLLGVPVLDHVIIGDEGRFHSYAQSGRLGCQP